MCACVSRGARRGRSGCHIHCESVIRQRPPGSDQKRRLMPITLEIGGLDVRAVGGNQSADGVEANPGENQVSRLLCPAMYLVGTSPYRS